MKKILFIIGLIVISQTIGVSAFNINNSSNNSIATCYNDDYDMVIISKPAYNDTIQTLINHKNS